MVKTKSLRIKPQTGRLRIGDDWNAITIIALSQNNLLKAIAEFVMGHHVKILIKLSEILNDPDIFIIGNVMGMKRNKDLYDVGAIRNWNHWLQKLAGISI